MKDLCHLRLAEIVLVDDKRANLQSSTGARVLRYCKVARYDGLDPRGGRSKIRSMGGIGAHNVADYETLQKFVEEPWTFKESLQVQCSERDFDESNEKHPVKVVVFDFDETLTLATFIPTESECATCI